MTASRAAAMSVVIVTADTYEVIRKTIRHVRAQTVRQQLEVIIVTPSISVLAMDDPDVADSFATLRVVEAGSIRSLAYGNAVGIRHATAPVVALLEDHSFPDSHWAEIMIEGHRAGWAAIGPAMGNPNPRSAISWADFLLGFATWWFPRPSGPIDHLPTHNASYKRDVLLRYGDDLETMLKAEIVLHWDLQRKGHALYLDARARVYHMNFERLSSFLQVQFHAGRVFATVRARPWPVWRRVVYAGGSPLIPLVRLRWVLGQLRARGDARIDQRMPRGVLPAVLIGLVASAVGELAGYTLGLGSASDKLAYFEFHRLRHVTPRR